MYWLRARFTIHSLEDVAFLVSLYGDETAGELTFTDARKKVTSIAWGNNPFQRLSDCLQKKSVLREKQGVIVCRLCGPDTVRAVAVRPEKISDVDQFEHPEKDRLLVWARHIDDQVSDEMDRKHDVCREYKQPQERMDSMEDLYTAIRLSRYVTQCVPCQSGYIVANTTSVYLCYVGLSGDQNPVSTTLVFDKDDGFLCVFTGERIAYLNDKVRAWQRDDYTRTLQSYLSSTEQQQPAVLERNETETMKKRGVVIMTENNDDEADLSTLKKCKLQVD